MFQATNPPMRTAANQGRVHLTAENVWAALGEDFQVFHIFIRNRNRSLAVGAGASPGFTEALFPLGFAPIPSSI
jgi:hypothetical protein